MKKIHPLFLILFVLGTLILIYDAFVQFPEFHFHPLWLIYIPFGIINIILPILYPDFWARSNKSQKYPDGFNKDIKISFPSFGRAPLETHSIKIQKNPIGLKNIDGTIELTLHKKIHLILLEIEIDTMSEEVNTWILVDNNGEDVGRRALLDTDEDEMSGTYKNIEFHSDILSRLDSQNPTVRESFESYVGTGDAELERELQLIKKWFEKPQFKINLYYKNKIVYTSEIYDIQDSITQEFIRSL